MFFNLSDLPSRQSCTSRHTQVRLFSTPFSPVLGFFFSISAAKPHTGTWNNHRSKTAWSQYDSDMVAYPSPCEFTVSWINDSWETEGSLLFSSGHRLKHQHRVNVVRNAKLFWKPCFCLSPEGQQPQSQWRTATVLSSARWIYCSTM